MLLRRDRALTAVLIMLDVAFHAGRTGTVSAGDIAERSGLLRRGIEPLLQVLSRSGLLESARGPRGGYRLGRPRRAIRLADIVQVISAEESGAPDAPAGKLQEAVIVPLWKELDAALGERLAALTLDDLVRRAEAGGLRRPVSEPISYAI
ncbi:MAG TPA: Rrf2 family transcriptional regulator [Acetobacteraceae bacterium]|nr:Rrf2 family transcriptional regulator [Acetobacteraceae bacterium]